MEKLVIMQRGIPKETDKVEVYTSTTVFVEGYSIFVRNPSENHLIGRYSNERQRNEIFNSLTEWLSYKSEYFSSDRYYMPSCIDCYIDGHSFALERDLGELIKLINHVQNPAKTCRYALLGAAARELLQHIKAYTKEQEER